MQRKKKIGFVAHGPASGNSLYPIINQLKDTFEIVYYAFHPYVAELWNCPRLEPTGYPESFSLLDIVIYGTGSGHEIERYVPIEAKKYNIPSISVLDCFWSTEENLEHRFEYPPTYLIVPNQESKETIGNLRLMRPEQILPLGNPHFDRLEKYTSTKNDKGTPLDLVFYSQCADASDYSDTDNSCKEALNSLALYKKLFPKSIQQIFVTPHPREDTVWLETFCEEHQMALLSNDKSTELLLSTDVSVGVSCTLQYEALIIGKPTIFYQNEENLFEQLKDIILVGNKRRNSPIIDFQATGKCVDFIGSLMKEESKRTEDSLT